MGRRIRHPQEVSSTEIPESEIALCETFIEKAKNSGWIIYPEHNGWDIVCVNPKKVIVGIQAKMHPNIDVLYQAIRPQYESGPHYRFVLVPKCNRKFRKVAHDLELGVISLVELKYRKNPLSFQHVRGHTPAELMWIPPVPCEAKAGTPSPKPLTKWRISAIRLCLLLEKNGYLTGKDFQTADINRQTWLDSGWLKRDGSVGRYAKYTKGYNESELPIVGFEIEAKKIGKLDETKTD